MIAPWKKVDRFDLLRQSRRLCVDGAGLLVVRGDDEAGRMVAADLVENLLWEIGRTPVRVLPTAGQAAVVKQLLGSAWQRVEQPGSITEVPRSVSHARYMSYAEIIGEIASCCSGRADEQLAFVFDTVDPESRMPRAVMSAFWDLAQRAAAPVIVFARTESNSELPRLASRLDLGPLPLTEVRSSLLTESMFDGLAEDDRRSLYADVLALGDAQHVAPMDAYDVLEVSLRRLTAND